MNETKLKYVNMELAGFRISCILTDSICPKSSRTLDTMHSPRVGRPKTNTMYHMHTFGSIRYFQMYACGT